MKVLSCALLFGLMVTISEGVRNNYYNSANRNIGLGGLTDVIANVPATIPGLAKKLGFDVHKLIKQLEVVIGVLEPLVKPAGLKNKIKTIVDLLADASKVIGIDLKTDFLKLTKDLQDKLVPGLQLALNVAKTVLSALKKLKL